MSADMKEKASQLAAQKRLCFVIGPIGKDGTEERKHSDLLLYAVIKHVLADAKFGYTVKRADEDADPGMIGDRVITDILQAKLVVADLTGLNANAFYELGIRHSAGLPTIHIAKSGTPLPFDNVAHRTIFVDLTDWTSTEAARARLAESARAIEAPGFKVSSPITQANASFKMRESADPKDQLVAELQNRVAKLEIQSRSLDHPVVRGTAKQWSVDDKIAFFKRLAEVEWNQPLKGEGRMETFKRFIELGSELGIVVTSLSAEGDLQFTVGNSTASHKLGRQIES